MSEVFESFIMLLAGVAVGGIAALVVAFVLASGADKDRARAAVKCEMAGGTMVRTLTGWDCIAAGRVKP